MYTQEITVEPLKYGHRSTESTKRGVRIKEVTYGDVAFMTLLTVSSVQYKTRLTHLKLLIHSTKTSSFSSTQHCTSQLYRQITVTVLKRNELQRNAACKNLSGKAQF